MDPSKNYLGNILIVDDNPINLKTLRRALHLHNYFVTGAASGQEGLKMVPVQNPDLILLDIDMPGMDGYQVCAQLKADPETKHIPIIFLSGLNDADDQVKAFEVGGVDYITKPLRWKEVLARVENQMRISSLQKELKRQNLELIQKNAELLQAYQEIIGSNQREKQIFTLFSEILPGLVLDHKYRLETRLGSGAFGVVYRSTQLALNRPVAVKVFRPVSGKATPQDLERFRREGIFASSINHPNAATVFDFNFSDSGIAYLVMELLEGYNLREEFRRKGKLPLNRSATILIPVCKVLTLAHSVGLVHRDIKPENIFLQQSARGEIVKVLDFGIAKVVGEFADLNLASVTLPGIIPGTALYLPPERLRGDSYDGRADVYSLGITCFEMLAGRPPYRYNVNDKPGKIIETLLGDPIPLRALNSRIPESMEAMVMRTLSKKVDDRPTAEELEKEFSNWV